MYRGARPAVRTAEHNTALGAAAHQSANGSRSERLAQGRQAAGEARGRPRAKTRPNAKRLVSLECHLDDIVVLIYKKPHIYKYI